MPKLTENELEEYIEKNSRTRPYPTLDEIRKHFGYSNKKTPNKYAKRLVRAGKVVKKTKKGGNNRYCHSENDNNLSEEIKETVKKAKKLLAGERQPTLEEIANFTGHDSEDPAFRENFHKHRKNEGFNEHSGQIKEEKNSRVLDIVTEAVLRQRSIADREKLPEKLAGEGVEKYIQNNKQVLEKVQVHRADIEPNGRPESVTLKFPEELQILLDRSQKRVVLDSEEGELKQNTSWFREIKNRLDFL